MHERNLGALFFLPKHSFLDRKILEVNKIQFVLAAFEDPIALKQKIDEIISKEDHSAVAKYEKDFFKADRFDVASVVYIKQLLQHAIEPQKRKKIIDSLFHQYVTSDESSFCEDLYLNLSQAKTMAACGMEFGGHGASHLWHNQSNDNEVLSEVKGSTEVIKKIYGEFEKPFYCYPYGGFDNRTIKLLKSHGFLASFTVAPNKTKYIQQRLFSLDRFDTTDFH